MRLPETKTKAASLRTGGRNSTLRCPDSIFRSPACPKTSKKEDRTDGAVFLFVVELRDTPAAAPLETEPDALDTETDVLEAPEAEEKDVCSLCHFCPQPLGLCIFLWLLILIVIAVVVFLVIRKVKKNRK